MIHILKVTSQRLFIVPVLAVTVAGAGTVLGTLPVVGSVPLAHSLALASPALAFTPPFPTCDDSDHHYRAQA